MKACFLPKMSICLLEREGIRKRENGKGGHDYLRKVIVLNISVKGGMIIQGKPLIEGRVLFEEIQYLTSQHLRPKLAQTLDGNGGCLPQNHLPPA